jgi:hypothetical protein
MSDAVRSTLWRTLLAAAFVVSVHAQAAPEKDRCIFQGLVRDSVTQLPVAKASVHIVSTPLGNPAYAGVSDPTGTFRFDAIKPGAYKFQIRARGYAESQTVGIEARPTANYRCVPGKDTATTLVQLDPEGVIMGRVTDIEGEPIPGAVVYAITEQWQRGFRIYKQVSWANANDHGDYRLKSVAGRYYLSAHSQYSGAPSLFAEDPGKPEMRTGFAVYPNATSIGAGAPINLQPGQQLIGISFKLPAVSTYHIRGAVVPYVPGPQASILNIMPRDGNRSPNMPAAGGHGVEKDGTFDLAGVRPGSYWLEMIPVRGSPVSQVSVDVTDRDVNGIRIAGIPPFEIKAKIVFSEEGGGQPLTAAHFHLDRLNWLMFPFSSIESPSAEGVLVFSSRPAGEYVISLPADADLYIQSISYNQQEAKGGRLNLSSGPVADIQILLATGTGQVEGTVPHPESLPPGTVAALVSAQGVTGNTGERSADIDAAGHFQFRFVPPGRYFVFVTPTFDGNLWENMDFIHELQDRGTPVEVTKKGTVSVEASLLTTADLDQARERIPR